MDLTEKILWISLLTTLLMLGVFTNAYAEHNVIDVYQNLKIKHKYSPNVCIFEPDPSITDNWEEIEKATRSGVLAWTQSLESMSSGWHMNIKPVIPWSEHAYLSTENYTQCQIFIDYGYNSGTKAMGTTALDFSKSWHKFTYITIYLTAQEKAPKITICLGTCEKETGVEGVPKEFPMNTIRNITIHEFGHAIGLGHYHSANKITGFSESAMNPMINPFSEDIWGVKANDINMLVKLYGSDAFHSRDGLPYNPSACMFYHGSLLYCD